MIIIGVDFHPEFQQIASVDTDSGEFQEKRLTHREDAETFYRALADKKLRVGMEASGQPAGSNDSWPSCSLSCGLATRLRQITPPGFTQRMVCSRKRA